MIFDLLMVTFPALIVYLTVRDLVGKYLDKQERTTRLQLQQKQQETTLPLRLQAYERLSLFCERIAPANLLLQLRQEPMTVGELRMAMLLTIKSEHNITQQVYVSTPLWEIIKIARDDTVSMIDLAAEELDKQAPARMLAQQLLALLQKRQESGLDKALEAIKKEAGSLLG